MKKIISAFLICSILLTGCGTPEGFTSEEYKLSQKVVEVIDGYLSTDIDKEEALERLERLGKQLENSSNSSVSLIGTKASLASYDIKDDDYTALRDERDEIDAEITGKKINYPELSSENKEIVKKVCDTLDKYKSNQLTKDDALSLLRELRDSLSDDDKTLRKLYDDVNYAISDIEMFNDEYIDTLSSNLKREYIENN